jgi:hypothetical protein
MSPQSQGALSNQQKNNSSDEDVKLADLRIYIYNLLILKIFVMNLNAYEQRFLK